MFEHLKIYRTVLVTGPQRSGTTIAAKTIAHDTGHQYVDENEFHVDNLDEFKPIVRRRHRIVVQCPSLCRLVHHFADDRTLVVLMRRPIGDIARSQERINWSEETRELRKYGRRDGVIADIKYRYWEERQRAEIPHAMEIEYDSLAAHPLFVPKEERVHFRPRQTVP